MRKLVSALLIPLFFPTTVHAAVVVNEVCPYSEQVELYNTGPSSVDLTGWRLKDGNTSDTDDLDLAGEIGIHAFMTFSKTGGWLNNSGPDSITLIASGSALPTDSYSYGSATQDKCFGRVPDGSNAWTEGLTPSIGAPNSAPSAAASPVTSPSPAASPVTASPAPSPTQYPSPLPSPSRRASPSPRASVIEIDDAGTGSVAGETANDLDAFMSPSPNPSIDPVPSPAGTAALTLNRDRAKIVVAIGAGLILASVAGFLGYRIYLKKKKKTP